MNTTRSGARRGTAIARTLPGALLAGMIVLLTACSGGAPTTPASSTEPIVGPPMTTTNAPPVPYTAATPDEAAVDTTLRSYNDALVAQNWPGACGLTAPASRDALLQAVQAGAAVGSPPVVDCQTALFLVFQQEGALRLAEETQITTMITGIQVQGDAAEITWESESGGVPRTLTTTLVRQDGIWLLSGTA